MRLAELHEAFLSSQVNQHTYKTYANGIDAFYRFVSVAQLDDLLDVEPRQVVLWLMNVSVMKMEHHGSQIVMTS